MYHLCFMVHYFYPQISSFTLGFFITMVVDCFYLVIYYFEKFSTRVWRLPFAINITLNLSINTNKQRFIIIIIIFRENVPSTSSWAIVSQVLGAGCPVCGTHTMLWQLQADIDLKEDTNIIFYIYETYTECENGRRINILLFQSKLAWLASVLSTEFKRIHSLKRG